MNATAKAEAYGLTLTRPRKSVDAQNLQRQLEVLLGDPHLQQKLEDFEVFHQLPKLSPTLQIPHPREARYIAMNAQVAPILPEVARNIPSSLWYALAGLNEEPQRR